MKKRILSLFLLIVVLALSSCSILPAQNPENDVSVNLPLDEDSFFEVHFVDVGQADCALVLCDGAAMLIDGGNVEDSSLVYSYLKKHEVDALDYMIATHPHEDHIGGLSGALNYASVDKVYSPTDTHDSKVFEIFAEQVAKNGAEIYVPEVGESFELGSAKVDILACNSTEDTNNTSIVLKITYGTTSFLFTADAEREAEQVILESGRNLKSTVLKVGHHGSADSTTYPFLREIMPEYAVISVGSDNSYGHPHEEAVSRLQDAGVKIYRTDLHGTVICTSNGESVSFTTDKQTSHFIEENNESLIEAEFVINTNSNRFHTPYCSGVAKMSDSNKEIYTGSKYDLIAQGYTPCGTCNP